MIGSTKLIFKIILLIETLTWRMMLMRMPQTSTLQHTSLAFSQKLEFSFTGLSYDLKKNAVTELTKPEMEFLDGIFSRGFWA
jgi:hypothetical protein